MMSAHFIGSKPQAMKIHEHASELGRWRMAHRKAHPELRAFVKGYVTSSSVLPTPVRERHLPSTEVPLLISFGEPHRHATARAEWVSRDGAWIVGLQDSSQLTEAAGERDFMIVRFTPLGAHLFLRTPMHLIAGQTLDLATVDPVLAAAVIDRAGAARNWADRFARIEALIAERVSPITQQPGLNHVWRRLEASGGQIHLAHLATEIDCSHRTLIAQFRKCVGQTPKAAARLFRFNHVLASLNALIRQADDQLTGKPFIEFDGVVEHIPIAWADIAADCGYFDQSHFIKEFRQFAGTTPSEFVSHISHVT
jgi:AraC-like DNA-binding protein